MAVRLGTPREIATLGLGSPLSAFRVAVEGWLSDVSVQGFRDLIEFAVCVTMAKELTVER